MTMAMTYGQKEAALEAAITASLPDDDDDEYSHWVWVCDFTDTYVIYSTNSEYFQDDYTMDVDGQITMAGNPVPVWPSTTYVPVQQNAAFEAALEERGLHSVRSGGTFLQRASVGSVKVNSEPLTYHRHAPHSYYRDFILARMGRGTPAESERLQRHATEMDVIAKERNARSWQRLHEGGFEYRVEPNRTDGFGGYFSPPAWINEMFATAKRPGRVLAGLSPRFSLPLGISSVNLPIISTGTTTGPLTDTEGVPDTDITDSAGSSTVVTLSGQADVALQALEQSPAGAHLDWVIFTDMAEDYDRDLESQMLIGLGSAYNQLLGVVNADNPITFTNPTPTGALMWPFLAEAAAQLGDTRLLPPECWLMRTARWSWLQGQESTTGYPFGISPVFIGKNDDTTPDPVSGIMGWPVFLDDAIPATLGAASNQDEIIVLRPSDLILFEGQPQTAVMTEVLSGNLSARVQMHNRVAAITNRYVGGIFVVVGTGMVVQTNY